MKLSTALLALVAALQAVAAPYLHAQGRLRSRQADNGIINIPSPVEHTGKPEQCAGYKLDKMHEHDSGSGFDGTLSLISTCNAYGPDYTTLKIQVRHETADRLRVRITDAEGKAHVVPDDVARWPKIDEHTVTADESNLHIEVQHEPFGFKITRKADGEVLFDTVGHPLIFEEQYVRVRSALAPGSHIQGLAQHSDNFTLPIHEDGYTRTLWTRDAYGVPGRTNLYGAHPFYVNQKVGEGASASGTFLLSSQGMDVKFPNGTQVEFNALGGIVDLFFLNGPTPADVARQGSQIWGISEPVPYWSLGFHSCRYGYIDIAYVAEVVANYTAAGIPLEVQWMDIDYMKDRWIQTLDPARFALDKVRYVIDQLQASGRHMIVMVDPATFSGKPNVSVESYETLRTGKEQGIFLAYDNGTLYEGVVWPGPTAFPDWTHERAQAWWDAEFERFFNPDTGVDVSGIWLDMNEPANFLPYLEANIYRVSAERGMPPLRPLPRIIPRSIPGFEAFTAGENISAPLGSSGGGGGASGAGGSEGSTSMQTSGSPSASQSADAAPAEPTANVTRRSLTKRQTQSPLPSTLDDYLSPALDSKWLYPPYRIQDRRAPPSSAGDQAGLKNISDFSARTDLVQANGARTYDEHNLYGSRHAIVTHNSLLKRRPGKRAFTIARSSFSGTPSSIWMGDNLSTWGQYIQTIRQMLQFAAVSGVGVVGADSCGFGGNTTETLCARWAWLGAFNTFYRNHNEISSISQEFYLWNLTTVAARAAGHVRLQLLDYTYSFLQQHGEDGTPALWPLSWVHSEDAQTIGVEAQFYYGPHLLVSPVVEENSTSVTFYLPATRYYDFFTLVAVEGAGAKITLNGVGYDTMPLHIKSGAVVPLRHGTAMTTAENRRLPFRLIVAPDAHGAAHGYLRLDDGESVDMGDSVSDIRFDFKDGTFRVSGTFGYGDCHALDSIVFAGQEEKIAWIDGKACEADYDAKAKTLTVSNLGRKLDGEMTVELK
ncbi:hypothetical protein CC85DRAFT_287362 [Cutaneotrichosporon oleaginosum]|uniref:Probable alpha/beta-glucosidase agdC n=1 Tax=Cutaneotrichosporon oleaginosum TaxID=879819 RepID=A0A0J0XHC0_9TREE|nr:uncharacterized protein CC85DRAFT_287362 [Cutaneotrichosporon oleaginosum]KLT40520.1 hypothetical protein CC85DRAFT_287362 [Cutaneotrichosporon oleaginosum]TXT08408.1 hypothetical protein COLE_05332 [Cutaneotrichosporon oleaginosum]